MFPFGTRARHMSRRLSALVNHEEEDDDDDDGGGGGGGGGRTPPSSMHSSAGTFPLTLLFPWVTTELLAAGPTSDFTAASCTESRHPYRNDHSRGSRESLRKHEGYGDSGIPNANYPLTAVVRRWRQQEAVSSRSKSAREANANVKTDTPTLKSRAA